MIVHARDVYSHFKRTLAVALASPEALAGLECHGGSGGSGVPFAVIHR